MAAWHFDAGLVNSGNLNQHMNAVLQVLFHSKLFVEYLDDSGKIHSNSCQAILTCTRCALHRLIDVMRSRNVAVPDLFLNKWIGSRGNCPEDLLTSILSSLSDQFLERMLDEMCTQLSSPSNRSFQGMQICKGQCKCGPIPLHLNNPFYYVTASAATPQEILSSLKKCSPLKCIHCNDPVDVKVEEVTMPPNLFVSVTRTSTGQPAPDQQLNLFGLNYQFVGCVARVNAKENTKQYVAYTKCPDGLFKLMEDAEVRSCSFVRFTASFRGTSSMLCLYQREKAANNTPENQRKPRPNLTETVAKFEKKIFVRKRKNLTLLPVDQHVWEESVAADEPLIGALRTKATQTPIDKEATSSNRPLMKEASTQVYFLDYERCKTGSRLSMKFLTGLTVEDFEALYELIGGNEMVKSLIYKHSATKLPATHNIDEGHLKMGYKSRLFMFLVRLRRGLTIEELSSISGLGVGSVSEICKAMGRLLYLTFKSMEKDCFPSAKEQNRTKCEQMRPFKNLRIILDGVEIKIETPSNFHMQGNTYSQYKGCNTVRFIVGIDSSGATVFISPACEGALSEKEAVLRSGLLQRLEKGDLVMTDRGFEITAELQAIGVHHVKPPSLGQRDSLTAEEETLTKAIACVRIYSEHAIADIKDNKLLRDVLPLSMYPEISDLVYVAGYLRNFSPKRIISKSFSRRNPDEENGNNPDDL